MPKVVQMSQLLSLPSIFDKVNTLFLLGYIVSVFDSRPTRFQCYFECEGLDVCVCVSDAEAEVLSYS